MSRLQMVAQLGVGGMITSGPLRGRLKSEVGQEMHLDSGGIASLLGNRGAEAGTGTIVLPVAMPKLGQLPITIVSEAMHMLGAAAVAYAKQLSMTVIVDWETLKKVRPYAADTTGNLPIGLTQAAYMRAGARMSRIARMRQERGASAGKMISSQGMFKPRSHGGLFASLISPRSGEFLAGWTYTVRTLSDRFELLVYNTRLSNAKNGRPLQSIFKTGTWKMIARPIAGMVCSFVNDQAQATLAGILQLSAPARAGIRATVRR